MLETGRVLGFKKRNIAEAIAVSIIIKILFGLLNKYVIHFVPRVEGIVTIALIVLFGGLALHGFKGMCISEIILNICFTNKNHFNYKFRTIDKYKINIKDAVTMSQRTKVNETYAERIYKYIKNKVFK